MKKNIVLFLVLTISLFFLWKSNVASHLESIPITFSEENFPVINASIEGNKYPLELSLTSKYLLFLDREILNRLQKKERGKAEWKGIRGNVEESFLFEIPKLRIDSFELRNILVAAESSNGQEIKGSIAWPFKKMNLLLDFPHRQIVGVPKAVGIDRIGHDIKKMKRVKCKIDPKGIFFPVSTSSGELRAALVTTCNTNIIDKSYMNNNDDKFVDLELILDQKSCGYFNLSIFEIPEELEVDVILGYPFLKKHTIFINAQNEYLYIGERHGNAVFPSITSKIPIQFTNSGIPVIEIEIGKQRFQSKLDLGSTWELILPPKDFQKEGLHYISTSKTVNPLGIEDDLDFFLLPECRVDNYRLRNLYVSSIKKMGVPLDLKGSPLGTIKNENLATIGYPILFRTNIYFDFRNSAIWFIEKYQDFSKIGVQLKNYEKVPFRVEPCGLVVETESDLGRFHFMVDTGASVSIINNSLLKGELLHEDSASNTCFATNSFIIGTCEYGKRNLYPFDISPKFKGCDGVLGMDFLRDHAFYIDYEAGYVYFQKPQTAIHLKK